MDAGAAEELVVLADDGARENREMPDDVVEHVRLGRVEHLPGVPDLIHAGEAPVREESKEPLRWNIAVRTNEPPARALPQHAIELDERRDPLFVDVEFIADGEILVARLL